MTIEKLSVLVLTAQHDSGVITDAMCQEAIGFLSKLGECAADGRWLRSGDAFETFIPFVDGLSAQAPVLRARYYDTYPDTPVDLNIVTRTKGSDKNHPKLLVADMESTIIREEMLDELAREVGIEHKVKAITAQAMDGKIDFASALKERVGLLKGVSRDVLDSVGKRMTFMPGALTFVATMKAKGAYCALVSGGFTNYSEIVARDAGFDEHQANRLVIENDELTGEVEQPILGREAKLEALDRLCAEQNINTSRAIAVGDGANDLAMLAAAGLGVAFRAKRVVVAKNPISLHYSDLRGVLYLQGICSSEFIVPPGEPC